MGTTSAPLRVVVLGGGFAGLETAFLLHHRLHDRVRITLVSDRPSFTFRPNTIYIPFGTEPDTLEIGLAEPTLRRDISFIEARALDLDPLTKKVRLSDRTLDYDKLVIATGATVHPEEVRGLAGNGASIWTPADMLGLRVRLEKTLERARVGRHTRLVFLVPPGNACSAPLYEMALMIDTWLRRHELREKVDLTWATSERSYVQAFGLRVHDLIAHEFEQRGIVGLRDHTVTAVTDHTVTFADGTVLGYDELVCFPPQVAAVRWTGLPSTERGFVRCELGTRQALGVPDVYAPGDAGDYPVKQAFLAFLEADATADHIAGLVLGRGARSSFDAVSMCVMEMLDKALFAQVPLVLTGDPTHPVEVDGAREDLYKVGIGKPWRLGKRLLGAYLPMRFRAGEPFHAGTAWTMMDASLKTMSGLLAE